MKRLDLRGAECPKPLYEVARTLREAGKGETIEIIVDSKLCYDMIMDLVNAVGLAKVLETTEGEVSTIKLLVTGN